MKWLTQRLFLPAVGLAMNFLGASLIIMATGTKPFGQFPNPNALVLSNPTLAWLYPIGLALLVGGFLVQLIAEVRSK